MRREYLGGALDFWKGAMLEVLRESSGRTRTVKILPMFTDRRWPPDACESYVALLRAQRSDLLSDEQVTKAGRQEYFARFNSLADDVFLDPDTGLAFAGAEPTHVRPQEVQQLLSADNIVAVYQHRPQGVSGDGWLRRYRDVLTGDRVRVIGYESAQAGMFFVTRPGERADGLHRALIRRLGVAAAARLLA